MMISRIESYFYTELYRIAEESWEVFREGQAEVRRESDRRARLPRTTSHACTDSIGRRRFHASRRFQIPV